MRRALLSLLLVGLTACTPARAPLAASPQAPAAVAATGGSSLAVPTANVRVDPAVGLTDALAPTPGTALTPHPIQLAPGATLVRRPSAGNTGMFLALGTPEDGAAGHDVDLRLDGALANDPSADSQSLATPEIQDGPSCALPAIELPVTASTGGTAPPGGYHALVLNDTLPLPDLAPFWVIRAGLLANPGETYNEVEIQAKRMYAGDHCQVFLDSVITDAAAKDAALAVAKAFDGQIYPSDTRLFGTPPALPADGRVTVVISPQVSGNGQTAALAYFARRDLAQPGQDGATRHSNHRALLFVDARTLAPERRMDLLASVAHEFQHLINYAIKSHGGLDRSAGEERWLDEAMAMVASDGCGYGIEQSGTMFQHVAAYLQRPYKFSLTDWAGNPNGQGYGVGFMFMTYVRERFGDGVLAELVAAPTTGKASLDAVLGRHGSSYVQAFNDWTVALANAGLYPEDGARYAYTGLKLRQKSTFGELKGPSAIRLGPQGVHLPRRADLAFFFHLKPGPGEGGVVLRSAGGPFGGTMIVP